MQARLEEILAPRRGDLQAHYDLSVEDAVAGSGRFGPIEHRTWPNEQLVTVEGLLERSASTSWVAAMEPGPRSELLDEVRAAAAGLEEPIRLPYVTDVFVADRHPSIE